MLKLFLLVIENTRFYCTQAQKILTHVKKTNFKLGCMGKEVLIPGGLPEVVYKIITNTYISVKVFIIDFL